MPSPVLRHIRLPDLVTRVAGLETRLEIKVVEGPDVFPDGRFRSTRADAH